MGFGKEKSIEISTCNELNNLEHFLLLNEYKFGYLSYDLKNCFENLTSSNPDKLNFALSEFFVPKTILEFKKNSFKFIKGEPIEIEFIKKDTPKQNTPISFSSKISKEEYFEQIGTIKRHIQLGDIYETNFCYEFLAENISIDPFELFIQLSKKTKASFASFCKFGDKYIISASPEQFIKKTETKLISQPIKGTRKATSNIDENKRLIQELKSNLKERSENIMIVDLVRNDLSKIAKRNSVKVEELCAIHSFPNVHQMVSTISCEVDKDISFIDVLKATFPMGSMTGAPKISAMKLIEKYESTKRGVYSGSVGYITPDNDFDFNVIIRTFLYNSSTNYISFMVGGAITDLCNANEEYHETLIKAKSLLEASQ